MKQKGSLRQKLIELYKYEYYSEEMGASYICFDNKTACMLTVLIAVTGKNIQSEGFALSVDTERNVEAKSVLTFKLIAIRKNQPMSYKIKTLKIKEFGQK